MVPDPCQPDGWYPANELLDWPTTSFPDGLYDVTMEIGDGAKNVIFTTANAVPFQVDNSAPKPLIISLAWRELPAGPWNVFPNLICPLVHPAEGNDLESGSNTRSRRRTCSRCP